jgi:hypothetical protein
MARLNSWKIAVVVSSAANLISCAYVAFSGLAYQSDIQNWIVAINADDFTTAESFSDNMLISEAAYNVGRWPILVSLLVFIVAIIGWTHTNSVLAEEIDGEALTHSTGWAIGAWFVPIMNLIRPRRILAESLSIRGHNSLIGLLNAWWALFILDNLFSRGAASALNSANDELIATQDSDFDGIVLGFDSLASALTVDVLSSLFSFAPLILIIILVIRASKQGEQSDFSSTVLKETILPVPPNAFEPKGGSESPSIPAAAIMSDFKRCPFCAEEIRAEAIKCKHCGSDIS